MHKQTESVLSIILSGVRDGKPHAEERIETATRAVKMFDRYFKVYHNGMSMDSYREFQLKKGQLHRLLDDMLNAT